MNDRELLERAAKAARLTIDKSPYNGGGQNNTGFDVLGNAVLDWHKGTKWNPLTDDGDALRLAVKLGLYDLDDLLFQFGTDPLIDTGIDPYAATRRAIVRAAAAPSIKSD